ncbi:hypothetical protein INT47_000472 [Mucor saturninus]|uniref:F-box domain-containing protein n=1 Tax=Mucor saturninus TaxID=64648 RepID=A0A8H7QN23_9FUNG|nr:hypothetical protein INT47_000472 [Mucor saturninus]
MTRSFDNFPGEILNVVFAYLRSGLDLRSLSQCELVCKNWCLPAQHSLYTKVILQSVHQVETLIAALKNTSNSSPGRFTRTLEFYGDFEADENRVSSWVDSFIDIFPQAEAIFPLKSNPRFYNAIIKAYESGKWRHMRSFGTCPEESVEKHNMCALLHKDTLNILNLHDGKAITPEINLYNKLHFFSSLKQLYLETNHRSFYESVEHITENVQDLHLLSYGNLTGTNFDSLAPYKPVDLSSVIPQPNIKNLEMHTIGFESEDFLLYLMTKFPELYFLKINPDMGPIIRHDQLLDKIKSTKNSLSADIISKFMVYVTKCQSYNVKMLYTTVKADEILNKYWEQSEIDGPRMVAIAYTEASDWGNFDAQRVPNDTQMYINLTYSPETAERVISLNYKSWNVSLPHLDMLEKCGTGIDRLVFCLDPFKCANVAIGQNEQMNDMANGYFFSHIIEYCTRLQSLYICHSRIELFTSDQHSFINTCLTDLSLEHVYVSRYILSQISKRLPCLKRLSLVDLYTCKEEIQFEAARFNFVIDMPESSLRFFNLTNHFLDNVSITRYPTKILLKLSTEDGNLYYKHAPNRQIELMKKNFPRSIQDPVDTEPEKVVPVQLAKDSLAIPIEEKEYNDGLKSAKCANIHVKCRSMNYLALSLERINPLLSCVVILVDLATYKSMSNMSEDERLLVILNSFPF